VRLSITDNGRGFDPASLEFPGNGLINMLRRMADIGGEFIIKSKDASGTEIVLVVPPLHR
jgi:signal transduction histidine kinase